ncbi:hypothetical protein [Paenibacillus campi]|uniref:hypothetical protein n=1 Tax=Paenibacillus campi TaxID=3106031 RepID=UPI002AFE553F|nr:hypothetical protein [Paenibacillus sp. SGZ-1014]
MSMNRYQKLKLADIKHKLPADSLIADWVERQPDQYDDELVWYCVGDVELDVLNLDEPWRNGWLQQETEDEDEHTEEAKLGYILLIVVEGNLRVNRIIANEDTDGATGLIVLGDLSVPYMLLGGQEVYVTGNVYAKHLLWGDYNHGTLIVRGNLSTGLLLQTGQYSVDVRGEHNARLHWEGLQSMEPWQGRERLDAFDEECVIDDDEPFIWRKQMIRMIVAGKPVLRQQYIDPFVLPDVPFLFENTEINPVNMRRVAATSLLCMRRPEDTAPCYEFWLNDVFIRAVAYGQEGEEGCFQGVYIQDDDRHALLLRSEPVEQSRDILPGLLSGDSAYLWQVSCKFRYLEGNDTEWHTLKRTAPPVFHKLYQTGWQGLLQAVSNYEYARTLIAPQTIRELLALPLVEPYDNFYDDERHGLWLGDLFIAFRQQGTLFQGEPQMPLIRVGREYEDEHGDTLHEHYFYSIVLHADGTESVLIAYKADENNDARIPVSYTGAVQLHYALPLFRKAVQALHQYNSQLLTGDAPAYADEFALAHWREQGHLSPVSSGTH